ncbi:hypothetical protein SEA_SUCCESS_90 [Streptomyces phage Success]|uniref:Uncharacterized protein n=1 Tax=Streptomyces phage Success TaxID=2999013 RepID=A0A9E8S3T6_9CAUD|nr:hypothetical protein QEH47_gp42 [Streptomyces phage Success]WAB08869.1 hypothetical protein SEA_SUCCESS_90 [Streptomyces phage Success]
MSALTVVREDNGHGSIWVKVSGPISELKRAPYVSGAEARKIGRELHGRKGMCRITSGATLGPDTFEWRTLYHPYDRDA